MEDGGGEGEVKEMELEREREVGKETASNEKSGKAKRRQKRLRNEPHSVEGEREKNIKV